MSASASFCCVSLSVAWAAWTISESAEIHLWRDPTERWILVLVFFAYVLAWLPVALLPYDIGNNITGNCTHDPTIRGRWWALLYVANLFTGYVANDYARSYIYSGAFTIRRKMAEGYYKGDDEYEEDYEEYDTEAFEDLVDNELYAPDPKRLTARGVMNACRGRLRQKKPQRGPKRP